MIGASPGAALVLPADESVDKPEDTCESGGYPQHYCQPNIFNLLDIVFGGSDNFWGASMILDGLTGGYVWIKALHVIAVISWMAGMFYLPRLFVYHAERAAKGSELDLMFQVMERKLLILIMNPAMIATWLFGGLLALIPGVVDWSSVWAWVKVGSILAMTGMHGWLAVRAREFAAGTNSRTGRIYRLANEVPTVLMILIVVAVIARPF